MIKYKEIECNINYFFKKKDFLLQALTHSSYPIKDTNNYQKLEFLGDSLLNFIVTDFLIGKRPDLNEGDLSKEKANIVNYRALSKVSKKIKLNKYILIGKSLQTLNDKILSDCYESLVGAILLDSNIEEVKVFIYNTLLKDIEYYKTEMNYKGHLIEFCSKIKCSRPLFKTTLISNATFCSKVKFQSIEKEYISKGKNKKEAEKNVSKKALKYLYRQFTF